MRRPHRPTDRCCGPTLLTHASTLRWEDCWASNNRRANHPMAHNQAARTNCPPTLPALDRNRPTGSKSIVPIHRQARHRSHSMRARSDCRLTIRRVSSAEPTPRRSSKQLLPHRHIESEVLRACQISLDSRVQSSCTDSEHTLRALGAVCRDAYASELRRT